MLVACLFISLTQSTCTLIVNGHTTAYNHGGDGCFAFAHSFFYNLASDTRPAIFSERGPLEIYTSTVYKCSTSNNVYGGAIATLDEAGLTVDSCCFRECSSRFGFAISIGSPSGGTVTWSSFLQCGTDGSNPGQGTIGQECPMFSTYTSLNISFTTLGTTSGGVSGLEAGWFWNSDKDGFFQLSLSNFQECSGGHVIRDGQGHGGARSMLDHCNFILNSVGTAILTGTLAGMGATNCVFSVRLGYHTTIYSLGATVTTSTKKFLFTDCIFPEAISDTSGCEFSGTTAYWPGLTATFLTFLETHYCPTAMPSQSRTLAPTADRTPFPTPTGFFSGSSPMTASVNPRTPTGTLSRTRDRGVLLT
jgi:hypothetical protein